MALSAYMRLLTFGLATGAGALFAGCAAMPEQAQQVGTISKECKIVLVDSASQEIRDYNRDMHPGQYQADPNTPLEQTYAVGQVGKAQVANPRFRLGHNEPNNIAQARLGC